MSRQRVWFQVSLVAVLGVAVFGSTVALTKRGDYRFFDPLIEAHAIIDQAYVTEPDEGEMQRSAITAMVESLDDPFTVFVPPAERREFDKDLTGQYVGIGALVQGSAEGWLTVVTPLEDSPAAAAGIMADDQIVEIEGVSTFGKTAEECVDLLVGEPGTSVSVVIERDGERRDVEIERRKIVTRTVRGFHRRAEDQSRWRYIVDPERRIAYVRLSQFNATTLEELNEALEEVGAPEGQLGGLIIDVRNNPGGLLNAATGIADLFIRDGVIVSTDGRAHEREVTMAHEAGTLPDVPLVVLINGQAASASEILSGALTERADAVAVGTRTFGKGSVQSVRPIPSLPGAQLKITEQLYYLPSGRSIHRSEDSVLWGVDPTPGFYVPMTREEMAEMFRARLDEEIIREGQAEDGADWSTPELIAERLKDPQLAAGVHALQLRIDSGEWEPVAGNPPEGEELVAEDLAAARQTRERLVRDLARLDRHIEETLAGIDGEALRAEKDLWPNEVDLVGGEVEVRDAAGNVVTTLRVTGPNLERWLIDADVEPEGEAPAGDDDASGGTP